MTFTDTSTQPQKGYVGRFAPSPSGPLHFGSLVCALASYLDAKHHRGQWLVRIEDIDPPREQPGASDAILSCLVTHGLHWDQEVRYQSQRSNAYNRLLEWLSQQGLTYRCTCTRKRLAPLAGCYDGKCRTLCDVQAPAALRLKVSNLPDQFAHLAPQVKFVDRIVGSIEEDLTKSSGDYVIHRKDGYFAYQLAVVADDIDQGITHVVRGADLLDTTAKQTYLYQLLGAHPPRYAHIPVILDQNGNKLSKQNHAPALDLQKASRNVHEALLALGISLPHAADSKTLPPAPELIAQAVSLYIADSANGQPKRCH